jgi:hypothetical protein
MSYLNLWELAKRLAPRRSAAAARWSVMPSPGGAAADRRAEETARRQAIGVPEWELWPHVQREIERRKELYRFQAKLLFDVHLPRKVYDELMKGAYRVSAERPDGSRISIQPVDFAGLQPDLARSRLIGADREYIAVRVSETPVAAPAEDAPDDRPESACTGGAGEPRSEMQRSALDDDQPTQLTKLERAIHKARVELWPSGDIPPLRAEERNKRICDKMDELGFGRGASTRAIQRYLEKVKTISS